MPGKEEDGNDRQETEELPSPVAATVTVLVESVPPPPSAEAAAPAASGFFSRLSLFRQDGVLGIDLEVSRVVLKEWSRRHGGVWEAGGARERALYISISPQPERYAS